MLRAIETRKEARHKMKPMKKASPRSFDSSYASKTNMPLRKPKILDIDPLNPRANANS